MRKREYLNNLAEVCDVHAKSSRRLWYGLLDVYAPCKENQRLYVESVAIAKMMADYWRVLACNMRRLMIKEKE